MDAPKCSLPVIERNAALHEVRLETLFLELSPAERACEESALVLSRIDANWFKFAIGALTVFAVVGNSWLRRTARKIKVET